ncbi:MAG TPA: SusC/RagA family TonB-linked outer membrane protein [Flavobacteriaceae bacterium]|nr:SusC/RagA family TonB-linked outer membrane protein [Flavobacteriaceae bacterium]
MRTKFSGILTLLMAFVVQLTFAQEKTITGMVSDAETGMPLAGVNIVIEGTTTGTQTDFDGNYSITASAGQNLVFTYIGYADKTVAVGNDTTINVTLAASAAELDQVVVTAFGVEREAKELGYQTETVDSEKLNITQPTTAATALIGKVAGLQVNSNSNGVKPNTTVLLRGFRSVSNNNQALVVIDGSLASTNAFDALNPNDIASISVLKGATAAVLYGSDAANGALIVTTKSGKKGDRFTIGLQTTTTFQQVAYMPDFQTEYGTGWHGVYDPRENTNWGPRFDGVVRQIGPTFADGTFQAVPYAPVANNLLNFYDTGSTFQNTVYLSGADESSSFYMSVGDQETKGVVPNDTYGRNTFRFNGSKTMGDLTLSVNTNYFKDEQNVVGSNIGEQNRELYWFLLNTSANIPLANYRDWQNDLYASPNGYYNAYYQNPYWAVDTNRNLFNSDRITGNFEASWNANDWLNLTGRIGMNKVSTYSKQWRAEQNYAGEEFYLDYSTRPNPVSSYVFDLESQSLNYTGTFLATGDFELSEQFSLKAIVGATSETSNYRSSSIQAFNLSIPGFYDISNGTGDRPVSVDQEIKKTYGYFGDVTIGFNDYLFAEISGRYDFTSTLPSADNSYFYPGFGLSFVASDAFPEIKGDILNYLKVTANNSTVYNDLPPYRINEVFSKPDYFPYGSTAGFALSSTTVDQNIKKEKLNSTELGLNMAFFKNRLTLDASWFNTVTTDLITFTTPSYASGANNYLTNIGELENTGYEISLGGTILKAKDFEWNLNLNFSHYETIVNEIKPDLNEILISNFPSNSGEVGIYAVKGEAFPQIKASSYLRDDQGRIVVDPSTGRPIVGPVKNMGKTTPDYVVGLVSSVKYKGFQLSAVFDYRTGHVYYSQLADRMEFTGRSMESVSSNRQDFLLPNSVYQTGVDADGNPIYTENTNIPVTGGRQTYWTDFYNQIKENYVIDATAVKMREVSLNYTLPTKFLDKTPLSKVTVGFVGRNLLTWLPEENRFSDPEFNNSTGNAVGGGGFEQSPPTRSYGFNVNIEF